MGEKKKEEVVTEEKKEEITFENKGDKKSKKTLVIGLIVTLLLIGGAIGAYFAFFNGNGNKNSDPKKETKKEDKKKSAYYITDNSIQDFDLHFLQLESGEKNKIYSPLSIKYALQMLKEGADGETKTQIENIIGDYKGKKYTNSSNLSLANAFFVKDTYKDSIKESYINTLTEKYNAEVLYDNFATPNVINNWVSEKTFDLVKNLVSDASSLDYVLVNALAIDMEWVNQIRNDKEYYDVRFENITYTGIGLWPYAESKRKLSFNNSKDVESAEIAAVSNRYDIVNTLGKDKIAETLKNEYQKWLDEGAKSACPKQGSGYGAGGEAIEKDIEESGQAWVDKNLDQYIEKLNKNYNHNSSSTDFYWYTDDNVKVFAKDLKEYDGTTLEYVGIMPTSVSLEEYVKNIKAEDVTKIVNNLKDTSLNSFKDGVITELYGKIPMFNFDYELNLKEDLNKMGIKDVFDAGKSDLSKMATNNAFVSDAAHKANIEFSNDGIKASAATAVGGRGGGDCGFYYAFDVPVEKIDLTFDKPYLFLIIDKSTKEVWFTGSVYEPLEYNEARFR